MFVENGLHFASSVALSWMATPQAVVVFAAAQSSCWMDRPVSLRKRGGIEKFKQMGSNNPETNAEKLWTVMGDLP